MKSSIPQQLYFKFNKNILRKQTISRFCDSAILQERGWVKAKDEVKAKTKVKDEVKAKVKKL